MGCGSSSGVAVSLKGSSSTSALAAVDATLFKLKVYKAAVSTSALCTNLQVIYTNSNPDYSTFDGSAIGSASIAPGTYPCIAFEVSDTIKFTPSADVGDGSVCAGGTEYTREVCRDGSISGELLDGTDFTCASGEQRMAIYLSTASSSSGGGDASNPFLPPLTAGDASDATRGMKLSGSFTVTATSTATFVVGGNEIVDVDGSTCDMQPPQWGFE